MSCYNWERGTITIPTKEWATFRKNLLTKWNDKQTEVFEDALRAFDACTAAAKGKRGDNRQQAIKAALESHCTERKWDSWQHRYVDEHDYERQHTIEGLIFKREGWNGPITLQRPKKASLDTKALTKDADIHLGETFVGFRNKTREVIWSVSENNRAVEHAHNHWFAQELFKALGRITWTRGSGGQIVGNDEYNRDSYDAGGGGNYVTYEFSPKAPKPARSAFSRLGSNYRW